MFRKQCLCCGNTSLQEIIHLGMHPMADTFIPAERQYEGDCVYPLVCDLCVNCSQIQLRTVTDPKERYAKFDYSYTSSNSKISQSHWTQYAATVTLQSHLPAGSLILEIGSNDGFLLEQFRRLGFETQGVDPSPAMAHLANARGISTEIELFSFALSEKLNRKFRTKPRLIVANNVFNHANDPVDFARGVKNLLAPEGTFVFELPYWLCSIQQGKFDQIYHEHVSYFTVSYAINLFKLIDMQVVHVEEVDYHGGSIRVFVRHRLKDTPDRRVATFVDREQSAGLFSPQTYHKFMADIHMVRNRFLAKLYALKASGSHIVCVGAAAKGNTFLNFYNLDSTVIDCVTDSSPNKVGKFTPRTRIPIRDDEALANLPQVIAIILSWNIAHMLKERLQQINPHIQTLNPYEP